MEEVDGYGLSNMCNRPKVLDKVVAWMQLLITFSCFAPVNLSTMLLVDKHKRYTQIHTPFMFIQNENDVGLR